MLYALQAPLVASVLLAVGAPLVARRCSPRAAVLVLVGCAVACAASSALVLGLHAVVLLGRVPLVAGWLGYEPWVLGRHVPVPPEASVLAVLLLGVGVVRAVRLRRARAAALRAADDLCARLGGAAGSVVVVDEGADAFALPVRGGRVVISRDLVDALPEGECGVLVAHERAHLRHHHDLLRGAAAWAAALDPLLVGLPRAVRFASERWADEAAAEDVGDRALVARALARAGLARRALRAPERWPDVLAAASAGDVVPRVQALLGRRPRAGAALLVAGAACLLAVLGASGHAVEDTAEVLQHVLDGGPPSESGLAAVELGRAAGQHALDLVLPPHDHHPHHHR